MPADRLVDHGESVGIALARFRQRRDRAAKQAHELADVTGRCLVAPFLTAPGAAEEGSDELVEHVDRGIRQSHLEVDQARNEGRPASVCGVVGEQERRRHRAFAHELPEAVLVNRGHDVIGGDADAAHEGQAIQKVVDVRRRGRLRDVAQPGKPGRVQRGIVDQQSIEAAELLGRQWSNESFRGFPPGANR